MKGNKNNIFKIIAFFLIVTLIAGIFISCAGKTDVKTTEEKATDDTVIADTKEEKIYPDLPDVTYDGYTFTFLAHKGDQGWDWIQPEPRELVAEAENAEDPINDAVYRRNWVIKEKYNIDIEMIVNTDEKSTMKKAVTAGDSKYDAVLMFNNNVQGIVTGALLTNISYLPYIDLSKPWWDPAVNALSIDNKNYLLGGDLLMLDNEGTNALLFNKDLIMQLGKELPYGLVTEGKWTMDKLDEYIRDAASDLNGDGKMAPADDRWGLLAFNDTMHAFLVGGGGSLAVKDEKDLPVMSFTTERNLAVIEKTMNIMYNQDYVLNVQARLPSAEWTNIYIGSFEQNRALFMWARMRVVGKYRGMEANFGILPMPKFDENQENYRSVVSAYSGVLLGVPKSADELERVSIILEALASESRYTLKPAYYDIVLQRKYVRDNESSEMLDIIFNTRVYDIGSVYSFNNVFLGYIEMAYKSNRDIVSFYDKNISKMEKAIEKVIGIFQEME